MSRKLRATFLLILSFAVIVWLASAAIAAEREAVEKKEVKNKEAQVHELKEKIQELKHQLELGQNAEKAKVLKDSLKEHEAKLEQLMAQSKKKPKGEFPEIEMAIKRVQANLKEWRQAAEAMQEEGASPEKLAATKQKIAQKEKELEELTAHLEQRRAGREDGELQIKRLQGAIKELEYALEHHSDSEKAETWKKALKENKTKLERLMAEQKPKRRETEASKVVKRERNIVTGWVISGTERDITIETVESGKIMVIKIPQRRRQNNRFSRLATKLQKNQLITAKYREGDELERHGVYYLQNFKTISFARSERSEQASVIAKMDSLENRLDKIEKALRELLGKERQERRHRDTDSEN